MPPKKSQNEWAAAAVKIKEAWAEEWVIDEVYIIYKTDKKKEMIKETKVFRSRISVLILGLILAIFSVASISLFQNKANDGMYINGAAFLFIVFLICGIQYVISGEKLYIKIWFISFWKINISEIEWIERSYNLLSSSAASLKRLGVYKKQKLIPHVLISPVKEAEFIEELKKINPNITDEIPTKKEGWNILDCDI
jgi:hypothetical protein